MERTKTTKHTATAAIVAHSSPLLLVLYQGRPSAGNRTEGCQGRHMHTSHHITDSIIRPTVSATPPGRASEGKLSFIKKKQKKSICAEFRALAPSAFCRLKSCAAPPISISHVFSLLLFLKRGKQKKKIRTRAREEGLRRRQTRRITFLQIHYVWRIFPSSRGLTTGMFVKGLAPSSPCHFKAHNICSAFLRERANISSPSGNYNGLISACAHWRHFAEQ